MLFRSVRWTDYRQILAHYYTGIDFLDGGGAKFAPDYRWNLLHHDAPQEMPAGQMRKITLHIQNTSAFDWDETVSLRWKLASACRTADAVVSWNHKALDPSPEKWKKGADQFVEIDVYSPRGSRWAAAHWQPGHHLCGLLIGQRQPVSAHVVLE
mgnify:CR=1 FL=1